MQTHPPLSVCQPYLRQLTLQNMLFNTIRIHSKSRNIKSCLKNMKICLISKLIDTLFMFT